MTIPAYQSSALGKACTSCSQTLLVMLGNRSAAKCFESGPADQVSSEGFLFWQPFSNNSINSIDIPKPAYKRCPSVVKPLKYLCKQDSEIRSTEYLTRHDLDLQANLTRCSLASKGPKHQKNPSLISG